MGNKVLFVKTGPSKSDYSYFGANIPFYVITANGVVHAGISRNPDLASELILGTAGQSIGGIVFRHYSLKNIGK